MSIKTIIEEHPVTVFLGALILGFGAGIGAYKTGVDITGQVLVTKSAYETLQTQVLAAQSQAQEIKELRTKIALIEEENQWYVVAASVKTSDEAILIVNDLKKLGFSKAAYILKDGSTHIGVYIGEKLPRKEAMGLMRLARTKGYSAYMYPQNYVAKKDDIHEP